MNQTFLNKIYTCSILVTSSQAKVDFDNEMKTPSNAVPGIPDRVVTKDPNTPDDFKKITTYYLSGSEIRNLKLSLKVSAFQPFDPLEQTIYSSSDSGSYHIEYFDPFSNELITVQTESFQELDFWQGSTTKTSLNPGFRNKYLTTQSGNFTKALLMSPSPEFTYSGSGGEWTKSVYMGGESPDNINNSPYAIRTVSSSLQGEGVDFISMEGFYHLHSDFLDDHGNSRVQYINWYEHTGQPEKNVLNEFGNGPANGYHPQYLYQNNYEGQSKNHGTATVSIAAGRVAGWAPKAKIYNLNCTPNTTQNSGYGPGNYFDQFNFFEAMDLLKRFHLSKSIDPHTGYRRPTVCNWSKKAAGSYASSTGMRRVNWLPITESMRECAGPHSRSIDISYMNKNGDGLWIEYMGQYWAYILGAPIGNQYIQKYRDRSKYYVIGVPSTASLASRINYTDELSHVNYRNLYNNGDWMLKANLESDGYTLSLTSSFPTYSYMGRVPDMFVNSTNPSPPTPITESIQGGGVFVYTHARFDSASAPYGFEETSSGFPHTGSLAANVWVKQEYRDLGLGVSKINSIVVNGVERADTASNDNYLNSDVYFPIDLPVGIAGDRNTKHPRRSNNGWWNGKNLSLFRPNSPSHILRDFRQEVGEEALREVAEAGVIICMAGGNRGNVYTQATSSYGIDEPFFSEANYDERLANNYYLRSGSDYIGGEWEKSYYCQGFPGNGTILNANRGLDAWYAQQENLSNNGYWGSRSYLPVLTAGSPLGSNCGPHGDVYCPGQLMLMAVPNDYTPLKSKYNKLGLSRHAVPSASISASLAENKIYPMSSYGGTPQRYENISSDKYFVDYSGTSFAAPTLAGMTMLLVERYPWMKVNDVREYFQRNGHRIPETDQAGFYEPLFRGHIKMKDNGAVSASTLNTGNSASQIFVQGGGVIPWLPPMSNIPYEFSGSTRMDGINITFR